MASLSDIVRRLDQTFEIKSYGKDPAFSRFIPQVYEGKMDWEAKFEPAFTELFNGLMFQGESEVKNVFLAVFPTEDVLETFIREGEPGDLLFMHHPLLMECGDPQGDWGRGFVPIKESLIDRVIKNELSIYTCHVPLDYHLTLGTSQAIAEAMNVKIIDRFVHDEKHGHIGIIGEVEEKDTDELIQGLKDIFDLPYVDFEGRKRKIEKVAIVAGCGDKTAWMKEAEDLGVDAYISGEIHCHIDNEYGRKRYEEVIAYAEHTKMSLIGVSHSASEYLVHETLMRSWFEKEFEFNRIRLIPQKEWWL
ncbi:Nif3-like dinuclear metal center hexameric protein [Bacillus sp. MCCB 382]|uniref:Nif3-like dinuclear metal center hexameric protein n=1 Tax=Bacillus sp. MCCB 382 TaxID=2860197 RepID=UPI001C5741A3|nr:Nif3-like dinuclear metal center hexameric protein [Bacillus sp. MCCB 382]